MYYIEIFLIFLLPAVKCFSFSDIKVIFGDKYCVAGTLLSLNEKAANIKEVSQPDSLQLETVTSTIKDKSAMTLIHELAQYNQINYAYELISEEGPPHNKIFTITLYLGDEHYEGEGRRIKNAQQMAADVALKSTRYEHPPTKIKESDKSLTPTVLLNNLAAKLGLAVSYTMVTNDILEEQGNDKEYFETHPRKSYLEKLNETVHSNDTIHIRKDGSDLKGPFTVKVNVNGANFIGKAHTIQNAKHEAALNALKNLKEQEHNFHCLKEDDGCKPQRQNVKSPISLVYEAAQKRNLPVSFEVIDEIGPSHKKIFTTKCTVGNLETTGEGKSKKESKRVSAENMLPSLTEIPELEGPHKDMQTKKSKKKKKDKVIKNTFDKIDRIFDNVVDFGKTLIDTIQGNKDSNDDSQYPKKKSDKHVRSPFDELLALGRILNLEIQYNDFIDNEKSYSILDLGTKPSFICLGEGINTRNSRDLAAKQSINVLYQLGLLDNLLDKSNQISHILDKEDAYQNLLLEVIENKNEKDI